MQSVAHLLRPVTGEQRNRSQKQLQHPPLFCPSAAGMYWGDFTAEVLFSNIISGNKTWEGEFPDIAKNRLSCMICYQQLGQLNPKK